MSPTHTYPVGRWLGYSSFAWNLLNRLAIRYPSGAWDLLAHPALPESSEPAPAPSQPNPAALHAAEKLNTVLGISPIHQFFPHPFH